MRISDWSSDVCSSDLLLDDAQFWTPYGATECLPVAIIEGRELLTLRERTEQGAGTCVGRPVPPNEVRIIRVSDDAIEQWSDALLVKPGQVGEITVAGPTATDAYFNRDAQRSEEHTSELQSLMRNSYAIFCLKKKTNKSPTTQSY